MYTLLFRNYGINIYSGSQLEVTFLRDPRLVYISMSTQRLLKCFILIMCVLKQYCFNIRNVEYILSITFFL